MKSLTLGLSTLMLLGMMGFANAQSSVYQDPDQCKSEVGALDADTDGFVTEEEMADRGTIETNVDTDGDGKISQEEMVVACDNSLVEALKSDS
jgi:Ca2+-binding EF-hand superfamily protein